MCVVVDTIFLLSLSNIVSRQSGACFSVSDSGCTRFNWRENREKVSIVMLIFAMLLSLCSCNAEDQVIESAHELIAEGQINEAYELLYANRDYDSAQEMLADFTVVYTSSLIKNHSLYNSFHQTTYNEYGDVISEHSVAYGNTFTGTTYEYTYGENGNMLSKTVIDKEGKKNKTCTYDENGNEISTVYFDSEGNEGLWYDYKYNENGNLTEKTEVYTYDELGNVVITLREGNEMNSGIYAACYEYSDYLYFYTL